MVSLWIYLTTSVIVALIALGVVAVNTALEQASERSAIPNGAFPPPSPIVDSIVIGPVRDVAEASTVAGFNVKSPSYLPQGYSVRIVHAKSESKEVAMLVWDKVVTEQTSYKEFLYQGKGIIIYLTQQSPDYNMTKNMDMWLKENAKYGAHKIAVIGFPGVAYNHQTVTTELVDQLPILTEVIFFENHLMVKVRGDLPEAELTKVAQSLSSPPPPSLQSISIPFQVLLNGSASYQTSCVKSHFT